MFQQFTYQRKSTPFGIKKKSDKGSDLDGEGTRNRTTKGFGNESNVIAIVDTPESSPGRTMDDNDSLSDEELLRSTFDSTENEEKTLGPEYCNQENQINSSPSKFIQKLDKMGCKVESGNGKVDEKENCTGSEKKNLENSKPKYSDQESYDSKSSSKLENTKKKRKRVRSFNDSDSDVHSTPQKKQREATEIEIISYTKRNDSYHSPRKSTDEKVKMLKEMFPNRSDVEILEAMKVTDNVPQAAVMLSNRAWTPTKGTKESRSPKKFTDEKVKMLKEMFPDRSDEEVLEAMKVTDNVPQAAVMLSNRAWTPTKGRSKTNSKDPEIIEIIDDEDDVDYVDDNNDNEDVPEVDSKDEDGLRNSEKATILTFLDSCPLDDLLLVFSEKKANTLIQLRPFESWLDLKAKLNSSRGLTDKAVHKCRSFLKTRAQVVQFMERCEKISKDIQQLLPDCLNGQIPNGMTQPEILNPSCKLKPYQLAGLHWLKLMHWKKMNCILADEMGLGKTIQALSFIAHLIEQGDDGPYLIVVPTSTVDNWVRELKHWCPTIQYVQYIGNMEERIYLREDIKSQDCQVIITTYQMVCSTADDRKLFRNLKIHYVIFDEGHMLKNMQTQRYQKLFRINAKRRLLLTGTPLQNNLLELMSLLHFVMPQMFGGISEELQTLFTGKGVENYAKERVYQAKSIMKPFVLRRLKKDVLDQLPSKTEEIVMVDLTNRQRELYDRVFKECYEEYKFKKGGIYSGKIRNLVMPLRLTSNHPLLLRNNYTDSMLQDMAARYCRDISNRGSDVDLVHEDMTVMSDFELHHLCLGQNNLTSYALEQDVLLDSGKFNFLAKTLPDMKEKGDRVLLFSQFRLVMDVIEEFLKYYKYSFLRLDGNTKIGERQSLIDQFNSENDIFIFLLSTKAGGLGINLTSANVVILHDIDFNPYNDKQAEDRCHRVGQTRDVHVYKLVSRNTIEEAILKRAKSKLKLEEDVVSSKDDEESEDDVATVLSQTFG